MFAAESQIRSVDPKHGAVVKTLFLALVSVQAFHSLEEYVFELWTSFPPATFLTGLVSSNLEVGFLVINISLVVFGFVCYWWPIRRGWPSAVAVAWLWVTIELINGVGHPVWAAVQRDYTPGLVTSLLLLPLSLLLARRLASPKGRRIAAT